MIWPGPSFNRLCMLVSGRGESRKALVLKPVQDTVQALGKLHMHSVPRAANPNSTKGFKLRVDTSPSGDGEELSVLHFLRHLCLVHSTVWLFPSVVQRGGSSTLLWEQPPWVVELGAWGATCFPLYLFFPPRSSCSGPNHPCWAGVRGEGGQHQRACLHDSGGGHVSPAVSGHRTSPATGKLSAWPVSRVPSFILHVGVK